MYMNNHRFATTYGATTVFVDSGTTFTYLPHTVFQGISDHFEWFCYADPANNCKGVMHFTTRNLCFSYDEKIFSDGPKDYFLSFPVLRFGFKVSNK